MNRVDCETVASREMHAMSVVNGRNVTVTAALTNRSRFSTPSVAPGKMPGSHICIA